MNIAYNVDCMEYLKTVPDKYFDLAVVDPPYGGGAAENENEVIHGGGAGFAERKRSRFGGRFDRYHIGDEDGRQNEQILPTIEGLAAPEIKAARTGGTWAGKYNPDTSCHRASNAGGKQKNYQRDFGGNDIRHWDVAPPPEYFAELARVSKNQIIWGANYFGLPPTRCFLVWRKLTISENFTMAMAEYAWTSFNQNAKLFECAPQGNAKTVRFHPTQKPVALYAWIYRLFAKRGDKILDTHLGSGSSRIAAYDAGLDFVGCEIDKYYFDEQEKRFAEHTAQISMFELQNETGTQLSLFDDKKEE